MSNILIHVNKVSKWFEQRSAYFGSPRGIVKAVDELSLEIRKGEILGLVGESGSGKTTLGKTILHLYKPDAGEIMYQGEDVSRLSHKELRKLRRNMQIVFQDPYSSLEPRMKVEEIIAEGLEIHGIGDRHSRKVRINELMEVVGLDAEYTARYPHELSGGQRQRISIARALALEPEFLVADEPVSALDVSVQAQIINLFAELRRKFNLTLLFISHDLSVVKHISDRIAVMYLGRIMEIAPKEELYRRPKHPYTMALLAAVPVPDPERRHDLIELEGDMPSPLDPPRGCLFSTRCPLSVDICRAERPVLKKTGKDHYTACFKAKE